MDVTLQSHGLDFKVLLLRNKCILYGEKLLKSTFFKIEITNNFKFIKWHAQKKNKKKTHKQRQACRDWHSDTKEGLISKSCFV